MKAMKVMKAIAQGAYGSPDVLELRDMPTPRAGPGEVLIEVRAAALNPADWHFMRGQAYVVRLVGYGMGFGPRGPRAEIRGLDVSGRVVAVGAHVTRFREGDEVFGQGNGTFAEYATAPENTLALKPTNLTFEQAAAVPEAASTALQGLRDAGGIQQGQRVLINGASGGVGTYAVQLAVAYGAHVTGVCSTRNVDLVGSLGAHEVVDYTREDFTRATDRRPYDVILDLIGNRTLTHCRRVLAPGGTLVLSNGDGGRWFGPLGRLVRALVMTPFVGQKLRPLAVSPSPENLATLKTLIESGEVTPVIDRTYPLSETAAAMRYLEEGHARGKVVIAVGAAGAAGAKPPPA